MVGTRRQHDADPCLVARPQGQIQPPDCLSILEPPREIHRDLGSIDLHGAEQREVCIQDLRCALVQQRLHQPNHRFVQPLPIDLIHFEISCRPGAPALTKWPDRPDHAFMGRRFHRAFASHIIVVDKHDILTSAPFKETTLYQVIGVQAHLAQVFATDLVVHPVMQCDQLREDCTQIIGVDLLESAQDSPCVEQREAKIALLRILVALEVAAFRTGNRDVQGALLLVAHPVVCDSDTDAAEAVRTAEDIVRSEVTIRHLTDVILDRNLQEQLSAPVSKPDLGLEDLGELDFEAFNLWRIEMQRRPEAGQVVTLPRQRLLRHIVAKRDGREGTGDFLADHRAVRADLDLPHGGCIDKCRLVRWPKIDGAPATIIPMIVDA
jgi:hypothetical protein